MRNFSSSASSSLADLTRNRYLVYNLRKRGGDSADKYFKATELIAGVKDMRFQALMPDVLHWLGVTRIHRFVSMSNMKHDALVAQGVEHVFAVPGESYLDVLDGLYAVRDRVRLYTCRFEAGAVHMAEAVGKLTGRPGVAVVTAGSVRTAPAAGRTTTVGASPGRAPPRTTTRATPSLSSSSDTAAE